MHSTRSTQDPEVTKAAEKLYPIPNDALHLYQLLKQLKIRLQNTQAYFGGERLTLWRLADVPQMTDPNCFIQFSGTAIELKQKIDKMVSVIQEIEQFIY